MMRRAFLITVMSIAVTMAFAQHGNQHGNPYGNQYGTLTVTSTSNQKFWLFIEDVLQNEYSTHSIRIQGLQLTAYRIRVEMDNPDNNCVGQIVQISHLPNQNNYLVSRDRQNNYLFGRANQPQNPFFVQNVILPDYNFSSAYQQYLYPGFNPNANYGQSQFKGSTYKGYQQSGRGGNQPPINQRPGGSQGHGTPIPTCMPTPDFNNALSVIQRENFDDSKLGTAKQVAANNYLCVAQIIQICNLFSFDDRKLDFAKYAYQNCVDKNNYFQLNEVFSFSSSKDELRRYIEGR